jgi:hypothetical protein
MAVEANYVDTHGQSEIGFGITRLLGFDLLPRIKRINKVKLYRPAAGEPDLWPGLAPAMTRQMTGRGHLFETCAIPLSQDDVRLMVGQRKLERDNVAVRIRAGIHHVRIQ